MTDAAKKAKEKYEDKRAYKRTSFNIETEGDLLEFANSVDFSNWVKDKIREQLKHTTNHH